MTDRTEAELFEAVQEGDDSAFERIYDRYAQRVRLVAWRISHRADWVDDLVNEAWCRAFRQRRTYDRQRPFLAWMAGIVQNVYREHCRQSPTTLDGPAEGLSDRSGGFDEASPEKLATQAEWLAALNDCVQRLDPADARIVRLRFFRGLTLRAVAQELGIPESTLREVRLPSVFRQVRQCLEKKGIRHSEFFPAHHTGRGQ